MERAIQIFAAVNLLVIGISHAVLPRAWAEFFILLRGKGTAGAFVNGFLSLTFGSIIVGFHNVWSGIPLVLTLLGWAQVVKSLLIFAVPGYGVKGLSRVSLERSWIFIPPGIVFIVVGVLLVYHVVTTGG